MSVAGPAAVLVDGYNLLHAVPRFAPRGGPVEPARDALERWLAAAARRRGVLDVVVVWDGRGAARDARAPAPLTVLYTAAGRTADERILSLCRSRYAARAASTWVVSSDRGVQAPARQLGFTTLGAMTFYDRWSTAPAIPERRDPTTDTRSDKPRRPTSAEVDELLDAFLESRPDLET